MKNFSLGSFLLGVFSTFILVVLLVAALVWYIAVHLQPGAGGFGDDFLGTTIGRTVEQVTAQSAQSKDEQAALTKFGKVTAISDTTFTIETVPDGKVVTFRFDSATKFIAFEAQNMGKESILTSADIKVGTEIVVTANEPIGSVENQYAVEVNKISQ